MIKLASCLTLADGWPQSLEVKTSKHRWHWCLPSALATIIYIYCMWIHLTFGSPVTSWLTLGACRRVTDAWQGRRISRGFSAVPTWYCRQSKRLGTSGGKEYSSKSPKTALIRVLVFDCFNPVADNAQRFPNDDCILSPFICIYIYTHSIYIYTVRCSNVFNLFIRKGDSLDEKATGAVEPFWIDTQWRIGSLIAHQLISKFTWAEVGKAPVDWWL